MQIALVDMQRRVQGRVPLPRIAIEPAWARAQQAAGRPLVRFADIPLEWSDFRLTFRQTADILPEPLRQLIQGAIASGRPLMEQVVALRDAPALRDVAPCHGDAAQTAEVEAGSEPAEAEVR